MKWHRLISIDQWWYLFGDLDMWDETFKQYGEDICK